MGYSFINIYSAIIVLILYIFFERSRYTSTSMGYMRFVLIFVLLLCFADTAWYYCDSYHRDYSQGGFYYYFDGCIYAIDFMLSVLAPYAWFMFVDCRLDYEFASTKRRAIICFIPALVICILSVLSVPFGILFSLTENGYQRELGYALFMLVIFMYILAASGNALGHAVRTKDVYERRRCITLAGFIIFPLAAACVQVIVEDLPFVIGIVLGLIWIAMEIQSKDVSEDTLTEMNNRNKLDKELTLRMDRSRDSGKRLFMFMMDANYFKKMNDLYGHTEGDKALRSLGKALKISVSGTDNFIARYGGDEFVALMYAETESSVQQFREKINETIQEYCNSNPDQPYNLSLSIGYAEFKAEYDATDFYAAADAALYEAKQEAHAKYEI